MKKIFLLVLGIGISFTNIYSQVGVNTENPQGTFHVKGTTGTDNDVVVTNEGKVGIGTDSPGGKLDVNGNAVISNKMEVWGNATIEGNLTPATVGIGTVNTSAKLQIAASTPNNILRLADGSQKAGHMLTCDAEGNAYWEALRPMGSIVEGEVNAGVSITTENSPGIEVTVGHNLSLSPGRWLVFGKATTAYDLRGFFMYLYLTQGTGSGRTVVTRTGEMAGTDVSDIYASPQFVHLLTVPNNNYPPDDTRHYTTFSLSMTTSCNTSNTNFPPQNPTGNRQTTNAYGKGYFYAIRVDRAD